MRIIVLVRAPFEIFNVIVGLASIFMVYARQMFLIGKECFGYQSVYLLFMFFPIIV